MPIYEYECLSCHNRTEVMQRFSDPPLDTCGECGGELRKLISAPAFQFKGKGWYVTDYARKDGNGSGNKTGTAPASEAKSSDSSTASESKSSTKESSSKPEKAQTT